MVDTQCQCVVSAMNGQIETPLVGHGGSAALGKVDPCLGKEIGEAHAGAARMLISLD